MVGHNLKIAWNLTRCAFYFQTRAWRLRNSGKAADANAYEQRANKSLDLARRLALRMGEVGLDKIRGGVFDCVERNPSNNMPTQFAWEATKDFWQQEQGILAYLILHGATSNDKQYPAVGARMLSVLEHVLPRPRAAGLSSSASPRTDSRSSQGNTAARAGMRSGYHAFELAYLAHVYTRTFVAAGGGADNGFCIYFRVQQNPDQTSINVLPDFMPPGKVEIARIRANGVDVTGERKPVNANDFQISLKDLKGGPKDGMIELAVEFRGLAPRPDARTRLAQSRGSL